MNADGISKLFLSAFIFVHVRFPFKVRRCPTQHSALSTQHSAHSTQHSALSTQHSALSTQHSVLSTSLLPPSIPVAQRADLVVAVLDAGVLPLQHVVDGAAGGLGEHILVFVGDG